MFERACVYKLPARIIIYLQLKSLQKQFYIRRGVERMGPQNAKAQCNNKTQQ